jgi:hypothetical protein
VGRWRASGLPLHSLAHAQQRHNFSRHPPPCPPRAQGVAYLISNGLLRSDPGEVASFLKSGGALPDGRDCGEPLNRRAVGEFLGAVGGRDEDAREFQRATLRAYASCFLFSGKTFTQALRLFLAEFRLPGEAQMIDRLMAAFAEAYARENAGTFPSSDAAYVLAFACIMLNTDLHKVGVKRKMTAEQFMENLRGVAAKGGASSAAPPAHLLAEVYADIAAAPLAMDADPSFLTFFAPAKKGWLLKRCTGPLPRWKRRFFLLADGVLYYFSNETDVAAGKPRLILPLNDTALQLVGSLGMRIVPCGAVESGGAGSSGGEGGGGEAAAARAAAAGRRASAGSPAKLTGGGAPPAAVAASPAGAVRFSGPLHSPRGSDDDAGGRRLASLTLKTAKRTDDGTVRRGRYGDFELRAETARERDEWAAAVSGSRSAPRAGRDGGRLKEVAGQRGACGDGGGGGGEGAGGGAAGAAPSSAAALAATAIAAAVGEGARDEFAWKNAGSAQRGASFSRVAAPVSAPASPRKGGAVTPVLTASAAPPHSPLSRTSASRENLLAVVSHLKAGAEGADLNGSGAGGEASGEEEVSSDEDAELAELDDTAFREEAVVTLRVVAPPPAPNEAPAGGARPREGSSWGLLGNEAEEDVWRVSPQPLER